MNEISSTTKLRVLYLGDWGFTMGPLIIETPFGGAETKDCGLYFAGKRLVESLAPHADVMCKANWELYQLPPGGLESLMAQSAALIVSDVEAKCFHLYPGFFALSNLSNTERKTITYPDRVLAVKKWVAAGGSLMMLGGWLSFSGALGKGGWCRSALADALPVECLLGEDLVESSAGFTPELVDPNHPIVAGLPWKSFQPILGYNELVPRPDSQVIVRIKETGHPLVVTGFHGKGRILIYASDPAPHWGLNFEQWEGYNAFWQQALLWATNT
jgi:uncharacterized membrane protein